MTFPRLVFPKLRRNTISRTCSVVHKNKIPYVRAQLTGAAAQFGQLVIARFPSSWMDVLCIPLTRSVITLAVGLRHLC